MRRSFQGQRLAVTSPQGRFAAGAELLDGSVLTASEAWGKHLFLGFAPAAGAAPERWLHVHLGLYGAWTFAGDAKFRGPHAIGAPRVRIGESERALAGEGTDENDDDDGERPYLPPPPRGQVRVRLVGEHGVADLTGPTRCEVIDAEEKAQVLARLGPDPILPDAAGSGREQFVAAVRRSRKPVGVALMDQAVIAGIGNIYRAELLFRARLNPWTPGRDVPAETLRALWEDAVVLMRKGASTGRLSTMDPKDRRSRWDNRYTYHRNGRACLVCATPVAVADLSSRRVYWCPRCQAE